MVDGDLTCVVDVRLFLVEPVAARRLRSGVGAAQRWPETWTETWREGSR